MAAFDNVIVLNGKRYRVTGPPVEQTISQFPEKVLTGNPAYPDHTLVSTLALGNFTGGFGRYRYQPGGDIDKFWYSTADTRWPGKVFQLPQVATTTIGGAASYISVSEGGWALAVRASDGQSYPLWYAGTKFQVAASNLAASGFGTGWSTPLVTTTLAGGGIVYITDSISFQGGQLWACADTNRVPIAYRYNATDITAAVTTSTSTPLAMKFAVLGENVYMAGHKAGDGKTIWISTSTAPYSSTTWTDVLSFQRDDKDTSLRFFLQGYSQQGLPCFFLGTGRSIFQIDIVRGIAQKIFSFPKQYSSSDVDTDINACVWEKNGNLYVSQGFNLWEFDGGGYQNISPFTNGDGLPGGTYATASYGVLDMQNSIVDVFARREELCLVSRGGSAGTTDGYVLAYHNGTWHRLSAVNISRVFGKGIAYGNGVIVRGEAGGAGTFTGLIGIWDLDANVPIDVRRTTDLASSFANGQIVVPLFNAGFPAEQKLLLSGVLYGGQVDFSAYYAINQAGTLTQFGPGGLTTITTRGSSVDLPVASGVGLQFKEVAIEVTVSSATGGTDTFGKWESFEVKYLLVPKSLWGWRPEVDLTAVFEGRSPDAMLTELKALVDGGTLYTLSYGQEIPAASPRYVRVSAEALTTSLDPSTGDPTTTAHLTLLEPRPNGGFV